MQRCTFCSVLLLNTGINSSSMAKGGITIKDKADTSGLGIEPRLIQLHMEGLHVSKVPSFYPFRIYLFYKLPSLIWRFAFTVWDYLEFVTYWLYWTESWSSPRQIPNNLVNIKYIFNYWMPRPQIEVWCHDRGSASWLEFSSWLWKLSVSLCGCCADVLPSEKWAFR